MIVQAFSKSRRSYFLALTVSSTLLFAMTLVLRVPLIKNSATADEGSFLQYGLQVLRDHTTHRLNPFHNSKMTINALQALPAYLSANPDKLFPSPATRGDLQGGRLITVLFTLVLGFYLFRWSWEAYGLSGGILSLSLYAFCPNILAHGNLLTTDMPSSCTVFIALYYFARFDKDQNLTNFLKSALATGLAQLAKFSALHLLPIFFCFALVRSFRSRQNGLKFIGYVLLYGFIVWTVINTGFLWEDTFRPLREFFPTNPSKVQGLLGNIPVPFAFGYFQGIVMSAHDDTSPYPDWLYFLGRHSKQPFAWYFPVAILLKTPLSTLVLFFLCLLFKPLQRTITRSLIFSTMLYLLVYFSFFHTHQIGLRYLLPLYPLGFLAIGGIAQNATWIKHAAFRVLCWVLTGLSAISSLSYYPHFIPYFNEAIGNRLNAYRYLGDSNLDWNQANWYKEEYLRMHPKIHPIYAPTSESQGIVLLRANDVIGIQDPEKYRWLREKHHPVGHIAYAWLIYELKGKEQ